MSRLPAVLSLATVAAIVGTVVVPTVAVARSFAAPPPSEVVAVASRPAPYPTADLLVLDRAELRAALATRRADNLARFRAYVAGGVYPSNTFARGSLNVWRDQDGHFCAAASIIAASGQGALVIETADTDNFVRLRDVTSGPLRDWILTSGFTVDEIDAIQKPFMPVADRPLPALPTPVIADAPPVAIDARQRAKETRRLKRVYAKVDKALVRAGDAGLDAAVGALMARPELALATFGPRVADIDE